jgi:hypothetical protein
MVTVETDAERPLAQASGLHRSSPEARQLGRIDKAHYAWRVPAEFKAEIVFQGRDRGFITACRFW